MPDIPLPPSWGPAYDERDLDALLSGETQGMPEALRPVAGTLAALRGPVAPGELAGEDAARAVFRAAFPVAGPAAGLQADYAEHGSVPAHTLILPSADHPRRRAARHRRARPRSRAARRSRGPAMLVAGGAAAVAVAAVVAFTGILPGSVGSLTSFGGHLAGSTSSAQGTGRSSGSQGVDGTGAASEPASRPTHSAGTQPQDGTQSSPEATQSPSTSESPGSARARLCREFYAFYDHPRPRSAWAAELARWRKLARMAGGRLKVYAYCKSYVNLSDRHGLLPASVSAPQGPGNQPGDRQPGSQGGSPAVKGH